MLFSIIVPAYNAERYLGEALASIDSQVFTNYEVVLIDDGSVDGTRVMFDSYAKSHDNVMVKHIRNQGPLLARRHGLKIAHGDYIVFLDADDCLRSDALAIAAAAIHVTSADIIAFHASRIPDYSIPLWSTGQLSIGMYANSRYKHVLSHLCKGRFNSLWGKAIRAECFDLAADYSVFEGVRHSEDLLQLLPVFDAAKSLVQLEDVLYYYRPSESESTAQYQSSQLQNVILVNQRLLSYGRSWGNECYECAIRGEFHSYLYLLRLNEQSNSSRKEKAQVIEAVYRTMKCEGVFDRIAGVALGFGEQLIYEQLKRGKVKSIDPILKVAFLVSDWNLPKGIIDVFRKD